MPTPQPPELLGFDQHISLDKGIIQTIVTIGNQDGKFPSTCPVVTQAKQKIAAIKDKEGQAPLYSEVIVFPGAPTHHEVIDLKTATSSDPGREAICTSIITERKIDPDEREFLKQQGTDELIEALTRIKFQEMNIITGALGIAMPPIEKRMLDYYKVMKNDIRPLGKGWGWNR